MLGLMRSGVFKLGSAGTQVICTLFQMVHKKIKVKSTTYTCCVFTGNSAICKLKKGKDHHASGLLLTTTGDRINDPNGCASQQAKVVLAQKERKKWNNTSQLLNTILSKDLSKLFHSSQNSTLKTIAHFSSLSPDDWCLVVPNRQDMFWPFSQHKHWRDWKDITGINLSNHWNLKPNDYLSRKIEKTHVLAQRWICFPPLRTNMSLNETSYWQRKAEQW